MSFLSVYFHLKRKKLLHSPLPQKSFRVDKITRTAFKNYREIEK